MIRKPTYLQKSLYITGKVSKQITYDGLKVEGYLFYCGYTETLKFCFEYYKTNQPSCLILSYKNAL